MEVGAKRGEHNAMAGELLSSAAQSHIAEGVVEPQAVEALQDSVGVLGLNKQVVFAAQGGKRSSGSGAGVLLDQEGDGADGNIFCHISHC